MVGRLHHPGGRTAVRRRYRPPRRLRRGGPRRRARHLEARVGSDRPEVVALPHGQSQAEPDAGEGMSAVHEARAAERIFMVTWGIADEFGGMTSMCLQRARMYQTHLGQRAPILTFEPKPGYAEVLA